MAHLRGSDSAGIPNARGPNSELRSQAAQPIIAHSSSSECLPFHPSAAPCSPLAAQSPLNLNRSRIESPLNLDPGREEWQQQREEEEEAAAASQWDEKRTGTRGGSGLLLLFGARWQGQQLQYRGAVRDVPLRGLLAAAQVKLQAVVNS
ncbi:hypothetical protein AXG93_1299s1240 [Marchantia polymorpha subsp. ruderalis]|uniref:Uncharacterized protein n=1 Tax=Marchantia polymorpha subsp. ruderalis TaxID=1480154 RepID=A0A176WN61_MARPO|nr:hypothetical protein AXG93_1299s1240 [Marchantia polymorpha subsp. ruderalis]